MKSAEATGRNLKVQVFTADGLKFSNPNTPNATYSYDRESPSPSFLLLLARLATIWMLPACVSVFVRRDCSPLQLRS